MVGVSCHVFDDRRSCGSIASFAANLYVSAGGLFMCSCVFVH